MSDTDTTKLVDAISALIAAEMLSARLKNTESVAALSKAKETLADILERGKGK
jgi:hypothetical protein